MTETPPELGVAQKIALGYRAAAAFARNPKALIALVRYQLSQRK